MPKPRQKTDSITHLVKIVAGEVFNEIAKELFVEIAEDVYDKKLGHIYRRLVDLESQEHSYSLLDHSEIIHKIRSDLTKAGKYWSDSEDALLIDEVRTAIATIAKNHSRSHGAIVSRILQKDLIESNMGG